MVCFVGWLCIICGLLEFFYVFIGEVLVFIWGGVFVIVNSIFKLNYVFMVVILNYLFGELLVYGKDVEMIDVVESIDDIISEFVWDKIVKKLFDEFFFSGYKDECCLGLVWLLLIISYCGYYLCV